MSRTQAEAAAAAAFEQLLGRLSHDEPHIGGFSKVEQLPELEDADLGVILAHEPALLFDAFGEESASTVAQFLQRTDRGHLERLARIGALVVIMLRDPAKRLLLRELRIYCERLRPEFVEQHGAVTATDVGMPVQGPL